MKTNQGYKYTINYTTAEKIRFAPRHIVNRLYNIHRPELLKKVIHDLTNEK